MSFPALLSHLLPSPDPRTPDQIERDVDNEFAFHLAAIEAELTDAGASPEQARRAAFERFGDPRKYRRQCRRIAMKERIMLQRINAVLMVIVLLAVIGVSVQMYLTQRYNSLALADITRQLSTMRQQPAPGTATPGEDEPAPTASEAYTSPVVYVSGSVQRPGVYGLPGSGSLTLTRLLAAAGDLTTSPARVQVMRSLDGEPTAVFRQTVSDLSEIAADDLKLRRDDLILVHEEPKVGPGAAMPSSPDEYEKWLADWGEKIRALPTNNWRAAFALGQQIAALDPEQGYRVLEAYWSDVPDADAKRQLIKAWYFKYCTQLDQDAHLLHVMNLGMTDPSVEVQGFPLNYLKALVLRDFSLDFAAYAPWYERNRDRPCAEVVVDELRRAVRELEDATGGEALRIVELIQNSSALRRDQSAALRSGLIEAGLLDILERLVSNADAELTAAALRTIGKLHADEAYMRRVVVPFFEPDHEATVRSAAIWSFAYAEAAWAGDLLLETLVDDFRRGGPEEGGDLCDAASALSELGHVKAIPTMIGIIDAQSADRTVYGVGYFGLEKLTGVEYNESHNGPWWRDWWEQNKDRFGPQVAALPIPEIEPPPALPESVDDP